MTILQLDEKMCDMILASLELLRNTYRYEDPRRQEVRKLMGVIGSKRTKIRGRRRR